MLLFTADTILGCRAEQGWRRDAAQQDVGTHDNSMLDGVQYHGSTHIIRHVQEDTRIELFVSNVTNPLDAILD